jgi:hypothetical protein
MESTWYLIPSATRSPSGIDPFQFDSFYQYITPLYFLIDRQHLSIAESNYAVHYTELRCLFGYSFFGSVYDFFSPQITTIFMYVDDYDMISTCI